MKKAIAVFTNSKNTIYDTTYTIDELCNLCLSDDINIVDYIIQNIEKPNKEFYIGSGKILELKELVLKHKIDLVVFDDEISPRQMANIEDILDTTVIDRSYVILDIFASRAKTREAILEINLARSRYLLPRLNSLSKGLSRQGGGSGVHNKGKGETKLELNKRVLLTNIIKNEQELKKIKEDKIRRAEKRKENNIPIVALVGYTNAGKSTTMNKIIEYTNGQNDKMVYSKDELFATLETSTRKITYKKNDFLLVDTIGFVSKLPHHLVNSFRSTLEEIKSADLIIHVLDISSRYYQDQYDTTIDVLDSLNALDIPSVLLLNKFDKYDSQNTKIIGAENIEYSNYTNLGVEKLLDYIYEKTSPYKIELELNIEYKYGDVINLIEEHAEIISKVYLNSGAYYHIRIDKKYYKKLEMFDNSNLN